MADLVRGRERDHDGVLVAPVEVRLFPLDRGAHAVDGGLALGVELGFNEEHGGPSVAQDVVHEAVRAQAVVVAVVQEGPVTRVSGAGEAGHEAEVAVVGRLVLEKSLFM